MIGEAEKRLEGLRGKISDEDLWKFRKVLEDLRKTAERRKRFNLDLVIRDNDKYYIVEMHSWPVWLKQRYKQYELTWKIITGECIGVIARLLAPEVRVSGGDCGNRVGEYQVAGSYYVSFKRSNDHEKIKEVVEEIIGREFEIYYVDEIVEEVKDHDWYKELLKRVKKEVDHFFEGLEQGEVRIFSKPY